LTGYPSEGQTSPIGRRQRRFSTAPRRPRRCEWTSRSAGEALRPLPQSARKATPTVGAGGPEGEIA